MNVDHESPDYGRMRRLEDGQDPGPSEIALRAEEAATLERLAIADRVTALRKMRHETAGPFRFHYRHKRKHH